MNEPQYKFRASYSVMDQWNSGNWEMAVKMYFKLEKFVTPQMQEGREWHEKWAKHIMETKTMPVEFGARPLINPIAEQKTVVQLEDWLELVGIIDCYDAPAIYEWKTGKQSSEVYAGGAQGGIYAVLATFPGVVIGKDGTKMERPGFYADHVEIHHYDQYSKKTDMSIVWITDELLENAYNYIVTTAGQMHDYFLQNDLYNRFARALPTP